MDKPSDDLLSVFAGVLRMMEAAELVPLRERLRDLDEHPDAIALIEREIERRDEIA